MLKRAREPFRFCTRLHLRELTGLKAQNVVQLLNIIKDVPGSVIYHHTHHFLQQHQYLCPEPPNDFAYWVRESLGEDLLGEQLSSIDTREFASIRSLRERIIKTLEEFLKTAPTPLRTSPPGEEFYFMKSVSVILPTPFIALDLAEFAEVLRQITIDSIYFHVFEARLRLEREINDFSYWIKDSLEEPGLAEKIERLDPYSHTMEGLRHSIIKLVEEHIRHG